MPELLHYSPTPLRPVIFLFSSIFILVLILICGAVINIVSDSYSTMSETQPNSNSKSNAYSYRKVDTLHDSTQQTPINAINSFDISSVTNVSENVPSNNASLCFPQSWLEEDDWLGTQFTDLAEITPTWVLIVFVILPLYSIASVFQNIAWYNYVYQNNALMPFGIGYLISMGFAAAEYLFMIPGTRMGIRKEIPLFTLGILSTPCSWIAFFWYLVYMQNKQISGLQWLSFVFILIGLGISFYNDYLQETPSTPNTICTTNTTNTTQS